MILAAAGILLAAAPSSGGGDVSAVGKGVDDALRACEVWIMQPQTHIGDAKKFAEKAGLVSQWEYLASTPDVALPPPPLRQAMHTFRAKVGNGGGIFVTVSDRLPFCHVVGGGPFDFQPSVTAELASAEFTKRWTKVEAAERGDMISGQFKNNTMRNLSVIMSYAAKPNDRTDRAQLLATAQLDLGSK